MTRLLPRHERRFDERHSGKELTALIDGQQLQVLDISVGGMKVALPEGRRTWRGDTFAFTLSSTRWPEMPAIRGMAEVRGTGRGWIAARFLRPSYNLMKCVSRHVAVQIWGDRPYGY